MDARVLSLWEEMKKGASSTTNKPIVKEATSSVNKNSEKRQNSWVTQLGPVTRQKRLREAESKTGSVSENVAAIWEEMNKGLPSTRLKFLADIPAPESRDRKSEKASDNWRMHVGVDIKKSGTATQELAQKELSTVENDSSEEAKKFAAAALAAIKNAAAVTSASMSKGKIEITEVRDFAGQEIEIKRLVDADSREASEKAKGSASSAVDAVLEQIKKKQKLSVLDKTKKDWGEFKEETKGLEDELDAYKKSSNQYLDKVSFLERADYRQFEKERDARLALQARRRPDTRED